MQITPLFQAVVLPSRDEPSSNLAPPHSEPLQNDPPSTELGSGLAIRYFQVTSRCFQVSLGFHKIYWSVNRCNMGRLRAYYLPQLGLQRPPLLSNPGDHHPQLLHRAPVLRDARLPHPESLPQITNLDMQVNISNFSSGTG